MSKAYKIEVLVRREYCHGAVIQIADDEDIEKICGYIENMLNCSHGDIRSIGYTAGVKLIKSIEADGSKCSCEVTKYEEQKNNEGNDRLQ